MAGVINITTLEELYQFLNEKGIMEIAIRNKNKCFKTFQKIALDKLQQPEAKAKVMEAVQLLNKNNQLTEKSIQMLGNVAKLNKFNLVLSGLNLCATCVGFAIMYAKLDKMSAQINEVIALNKDIEGVHVNYEVKKILSEHSNMVDCRKTQNYYSEEKMRALVAGEYDVLELLTDVFLKDISNDQETLIFSILSLASMLAVSLKYFDETYYFNNKEAIGDGDIWHLDHDKWVSVFDKMSGPEFIERIQDYGFFDMGLTTVENDCFYKSFYDQTRGLKQEIEDNQTLIITIDDAALLRSVIEQSTESIKSEIETALKDVGIDSDICNEAIRVAVA